MPESNQRNPLTQYIMFKVALKQNDPIAGMFNKSFSSGTKGSMHEASEHLENICHTSTKDDPLLYACVLEAQKTGHRLLTVNALQNVLKKHDYGALPVIHLPALLRYNA